MKLAANDPLTHVVANPEILEHVRVLSRVSNGRAAFAILRQWLIIAATIAIATHLDHWIGYLLGMIVIASRQHTLAVIMHDATHYRLFSNRWANDLICDFFCGFPIALSTLGYREEHLAHHHAVNTVDDPYYAMFLEDGVWHWPKTRWAAVRVFLADILIWNLPRNIRMMARWSPLERWRHDFLDKTRRNDALRYSLFLAGLATALTLLDGWLLYLILWVTPALTFLMLFTRLRWISEHMYRPATDELHDTRHVQGTLLERWCIAPLNVNYHIAHHLFPSVPFYNLPRLHDLLMGHDYYKEETKRYPSYLSSKDSVLAELLRDRDDEQVLSEKG